MTTTVGRKKHADIWAHFPFNEDEKKVEYIVI